MVLNQDELEKHFENGIGRKILISICADEIGPAQLSTDEVSKLEQMNHEKKRRSFLQGRNALKTLIQRIHSQTSLNLSKDMNSVLTVKTIELCDEHINTCSLRMPHPRFSLSHSGDLAIAIASENANGLGVDLEKMRTVRPGSERFFLSDRERDWLKTIDDEERKNNELLRLWTVKESLFKSDLANSGKTVMRYETDNPALEAGSAHSGTSGIDSKQYVYCSFHTGDFWLTIAFADTDKVDS